MKKVKKRNGEEGGVKRVKEVGKGVGKGVRKGREKGGEKG